MVKVITGNPSPPITTVVSRTTSDARFAQAVRECLAEAAQHAMPVAVGVGHASGAHEGERPEHGAERHRVEAEGPRRAENREGEPGHGRADRPRGVAHAPSSW